MLLVDHDVRVEDFGAQKVAKIIFISIKNLFEKGTNTISPIEIDQDIERYEASSVIYKQERGLDVLKDSFDLSEEKNFKYYYTRLKKLTLLRVLLKQGYDISPYYKKDFESMEEENETLERFDSATIEDILNYVEGNYNRIKQEFLIGKKEDAQAANGIDELIDGLMEKPEIGVPLCGEMLSTITSGARLGKYYLRASSSGTGKRIADYTAIPTPDGWKTVGEIKVGDYIFGKDGKPTKVLQLFKNTEKIWKVTFKDGRAIDCCGDHLWEYYSNGYEKRVESIQQIYERTKELKGGLRNADGNGWRFSIPMNEPVQYQEKTLYPSPYIMGLILGDGSLRYQSDQRAFFFSSKNEELPQVIADYFNLNLKRNSEKNYNWSFQFKEKRDNKRKNIWVEEILKDYPQLWDAKSENKFIPSKYLLGSIEQRFELLKGLLDTDGGIDLKGRVNFTTVSKQLAKNVCELCHSLGMITSIGIDTHKEYKASGRKCYCVHIQCKKSIKPLLFNLSSKKQRAEQYVNNGKREEYKDKLPIIKIEPTEEAVPMTCFTVDAPDALYQVGDFIVTHNTRTMAFDACKICFPVYWSHTDNNFVREVDENGQTRPARKTLFITTELAKDEVQTMILSYLSGVNESHLLLSTFSEGEIERIRFAAKIMQKYQEYLFIDSIPDPNLTNIQSTIKKYATLDKVKYVFYDYLFSSPSLLGQFSGMRVREDVALMMLSTQLKDLATEYNIFISSATQVNAEAMNGEGFKNETCVRGSKAIIDKCDCSFAMLKVDEEQQKSLMNAIRAAGYAPPKRMPTHRFDIFKNRRGQYKNVSVWSYIDLGTGEHEDLYITTASGKILKNFFILEDTTYRKVVLNG